MGFAYSAREVAELRRKQTVRVMPLVSQLLEAWDQVPNDVRSYMAEQAPGLVENLIALESAMKQ